MQMYKLRKIGKFGSQIKYGITIPFDVVDKFGENTFFKLEISGTSFIFNSGTSLIPTKKEVEDLDLEDL